MKRIIKKLNQIEKNTTQLITNWAHLGFHLICFCKTNVLFGICEKEEKGIKNLSPIIWFGKK